jgi:cell division transport system permease protein
MIARPFRRRGAPVRLSYGTGKDDIPLGRGGPDGYLAWILAPIIYLAALALAITIVASDALLQWDVGLSGDLTVQVPTGADEAETRRIVEDVVATLASAEGIAGVDVLSAEERARLLEPWLGDAGVVAELDLPVVIDVTASDRDLLDLIGLTLRLEGIDAGITVDDHGAWLNQVLGLAETVMVIALFTLGVVLFAAIAALVFATAASLAIHWHTISLLHLMGASDGFIARQFQRHMVLHTAKGTAAGLVLAALTLLLFDWITGGIPAVLLNLPTLGLAGWLMILALLPIAVVLAFLTARITVMTTLARLP